MRSYREDRQVTRTDTLVKMTPEEHEQLRGLVIEEISRSGMEHRDPEGYPCVVNTLTLGTSHGVYTFEVRVRTVPDASP